MRCVRILGVRGTELPAGKEAICTLSNALS